MSERLAALGIYPGRVFDRREPVTSVLLSYVPVGATFEDNYGAIWRKKSQSQNGWEETVKGRLTKTDADHGGFITTLKLIAIPSGNAD